MPGALVARAGLALALLMAAVGGCDRGDSGAGGGGPLELSVMTFNIEYGGDRVDFGRVVEAIRAAGADVVGVQEAWGHIPRLAEELGWQHFDTRMHIVSRYPLIDPGGADGRYVLAEVQPGHVVALGNVHLPADPFGPSEVRDGAPADVVLELERRLRLPAIAGPLAALSALAAAGVPAFLTGDLNSPAASDWVVVGQRPHVRYPLAWPVSRAVEAAGFRDSYRALHPDPLAEPGLTWPAARPRVAGWNPEPDETQERIDFVFAAGNAVPLASRIVGEPGAADVAVSVDPWPTDHRGVVSTFRVVPAPMPALVAVASRSVTVGEALDVAVRAPDGSDARVVVRSLAGEAVAEGVAARAITQEAAALARLRFATESMSHGAYEVVLLDAAQGEELARTDVLLLAAGSTPELRLDEGTASQRRAAHRHVDRRARQPLGLGRRLRRRCGSRSRAAAPVALHRGDDQRWDDARRHRRRRRLAPASG